MVEAVMDRNDVAELVAVTENRRHLYDFLSRCYRTEMDGEFAQALSSMEFACDDQVLMEQMEQMKRCVSDADDALLEHFAVLYNRIFFGMGPIGAKRAFPYESVYTSQKGLLMQDAYEATRIEYRMHGLEKSQSFPEPDDHLAVQLAFVAWLCGGVVEAAGAGDEAAVENALTDQLRFITNHLMNWVDRFTAEMAIATQAAAAERDEGDNVPELFYLALAKFTILFLCFDVESMQSLLGC